MEIYKHKIPADNLLLFRRAGKAFDALNELKRLGAKEIADTETDRCGGWKVRLNGEVYYINIR